MLVACTSTPTHYMGIDLSQADSGATVGSSEQFRAEILDGLRKLQATGCPAEGEALSPECARQLGELTRALTNTPAYLERLPLVSLARRAQAGDKHAQFELGRRFEEGRDVQQDYKLARKLYRLAANDTHGTRIAFVRGVGGMADSVQAVPGGPITPGLKEARERLAALDEQPDK